MLKYAISEIRGRKMLGELFRGQPQTSTEPGLDPMIRKFGPYGSKKDQNFSVGLGDDERFSEIRIFHGWMVDGVDFWKAKADGTTYGPFRIGGLGGDNTKIVLKEGEYLTRISGKHGYDVTRCHEAIASLTIHTNLRPEGYGPFGLAKDVGVAYDFESSFVSDDPVIQVFGRGGNQVESIGVLVTMRKELEWCGPYGSQLRENYEMQLEYGEHIKEVIVRHEFIVDSIEFVIGKLGGSTTTKNFGGYAGEESKIVLKDGEYLTNFSGTYGYHRSEKKCIVSALSIHTNLCPEGYGPYGRREEVDNLHDFSSPILKGSITGVFGRHTNYLESIGVIVEKEQLIESHGPYGSQLPQSFYLKLKDGERFSVIILTHGWIINKIGFVICKPGMPTTPPVMFGGDGGEDSKILLGDGEYLTRISGTYGNDKRQKTEEIVSLKIHTNLCPAGYGPYGLGSDVETAYDFSSPHLTDGPVVGVFGRSSTNNLESIGVLLQKGVVIESYGPYGSPLEQNYVLQLKDGERISEVIIAHGYFVDAIGFVVTKPCRGSTNIGKIGDKGKQKSKIVLEDGEYLTRISGTYGNNKEDEKIDLIATLKIHTNLRPAGYGPFGLGKRVHTMRDFSSPVLNEAPIVGVFGRINNYVESIGVLLKKEIQPVNYRCC